MSAFFRTTILFAAAILVLSALSFPAAAHAHPDEPLCFDRPGIADCIAGRFRQVWETRGGLPVFGYPLTPVVTYETSEGAFVTQYFERVRFEYHPERQPPFDVLLGRLGVEHLAAQGVGWQDYPPAPPDAPHRFPATNHAIAHEPFWQAWSAANTQHPALPDAALALFGLPLSEPHWVVNSSGDTVLTQWFERARFEDHGANGVMFGRLGAELRPTEPLLPAPPPPARWDAPSRPPPASQSKVAYLTFDDGPFPLWTAQILDVLRRHQARATFFVIGRQVPAYPSLLQQAAADGHTFGNHTFNHRTLVGISRADFRAEISAAQAVLGPYATACLRPPGGAIDPIASRYAAEMGYRIAIWDIDPRDWERPGAHVIVERVMSAMAPGKIILLHDGGGDRSQTVEALDLLLNRLAAEGYRFEALC